MCREKKATKHQRYKKLVAKCDGDAHLLKKTYICLKCRSLPKQNLNNKCGLFDSESYVTFEKKIIDHVNVLQNNGIQIPASRSVFYNDVKKLLEVYFLRDFIVNVKDNKVVSVVIKNIPFVGDHEIKIKEQK